MSNFKYNYAFATGHQVTSEVAELILADGGNVFDATVACYLASFISEPMMASAGAGGFANILLKDGTNFILDFFCETPKVKLTPAIYNEVSVDFGESTELFYTGAASMAVPGAMAMISFLSKHYCRMPLVELVKPAIDLASNGLIYTNFQAEDTKLLANILLQSEEGRRLFTLGSKLIKEGDLFKLAQYADFLENFAREKFDWFYKGEIAQSIHKYSVENGGHIRYQDLVDYQLRVRRPYNFGFRSREISVPSLPSLGGGLMKIFLDQFEDSSYEVLENQHFLALRSAFANAQPYLENPKKLFELLKLIEDDEFSNRIAGGTSHFNIVDKFGNAIALSTSIGEGCGFFIPNTDMQMNNMLGEPGLMPSGLGSWLEAKRLNSMMCPTLVFDEQKKLELLIGSGGSSRIPFSIAQVLINKYLSQKNLKDSILMPRMFESSDKIYLEQGFNFDKNSIAKEVVEWKNLNMLFGGTHCIDLTQNLAYGDPRREGHAKLV